jgi:hypothetical protein
MCRRRKLDFCAALCWQTAVAFMRRRVGWSGGHDLSVRELDGQHPIGGEGEGPAVVVDVVMVPFAQGQQIVEVGESVVAPPDDVMQLGA